MARSLGHEPNSQIATHRLAGESSALLVDSAYWRGTEVSIPTGLPAHGFQDRSQSRLSSSRIFMLPILQELNLLEEIAYTNNKNQKKPLFALEKNLHWYNS